MENADKNKNITAEHVLRIIEDAAPSLISYGVTEVLIFGSLARGDFSEGSDIDILIDFHEKNETYDNLLAVTDLLETLLGTKVDVVTRNGLSPHVAPYINKEARRAKIA